MLLKYSVPPLFPRKGEGMVPVRGPFTVSDIGQIGDEIPNTVYEPPTPQHYSRDTEVRPEGTNCPPVCL